MPQIDYAEIEQRKRETPQESAARLKEQLRQEREALNAKNRAIYKSPLDQAKAQFEAGKISQGQLDDVAIARRENTLAKLREFGYSDEDIAKFSEEDFDLAADFFGRFNNPKPRKF